MTTEINERYVKIETNGSIPPELMHRLIQQLSTTPSFFEGKPEVRGGIFALTDAMLRFPDDGELVRNPGYTGGGDRVS